ncbi:uncharacterized protein TNCV_891031 [Trichonephila clavipes]|nr:uncharacterized protein TNCV_891031 [Trichonephila clavipes]
MMKRLCPILPSPPVPKKLESSHKSLEIFSENKFETCQGDRIVTLTNLISLFAIVFCPDCYYQGVELIEDSVSGLCSNMNLKCKYCSFFKAFPTTEKMNGSCLLNSLIVLGLRIIGKGFSAGKKTMFFPWLTIPVKTCFPQSRKETIEKQLILRRWDSKGYEAVKNFYGTNSVTKLECIGHVQKTCRGRLRQLKNNERFGRENKLIDRIQNFYGIAIRSNVGYLQKMKSGVIAEVFHCVSGKKNSLHGQCPDGSESSCRYQSAKSARTPLKESKLGLSNKPDKANISETV